MLLETIDTTSDIVSKFGDTMYKITIMINSISNMVDDSSIYCQKISVDGDSR